MTDSRLADLERRVIEDALAWYFAVYQTTLFQLPAADLLARSASALIDARKRVPTGQLPLLRESPDDVIR